MSIKKKSVLLTAILILAAAAVFFLLLPRRAGTEPLYQTEAVTRGDIDAQIVTSGTLTPVNQVDVGSSVSHGAVVAREYGLPAVVDLRHATRMFKTGDRVTLDGDHGILQLADR